MSRSKLFFNCLAVSALITAGVVFGNFLFANSTKAESSNNSAVTVPGQNSVSYCAIAQIASPLPPPNQLEFIGNVDVYCFARVKDKDTGDDKYFSRRTVSYKLNYGSFLQEIGAAETVNARQLAATRAGEMAFAKALVELGDAGYEMIGDGFRNAAFQTAVPSTDLQRAVYFKRINKSGKNE